MSDFIERAKVLRKQIEAMATNMDDNTAMQYPELCPVWDARSTYQAGHKVRYNDVLYKCLQGHTAQSGWTPTAAPSLWAKCLSNSDTGVIAEWEQPDSTNPYKKGDKVTYKGKMYESTIDNNVWAPDAYPAGWKEITK